MTLMKPKDRVNKATVLLVDDSLTFRSTLGDRLRREGHAVHLADSGEQALEALGQVPDIIIVDLVMPGIDGIETCRRIWATAGCAEVPILLLTARDDLPARMRGRVAGASEFLVKLDDFEAVVASVRDFVRRATTAPGSGKRRDGRVLARVVAASGLAQIIAEAAITRACARAGIDAEAMTEADLGRALPDIERAIGMFLDPADRAARLGAIAAIVGQAPAPAGSGR
jgi:DNA-binding response OmpR family regulator